MQLIVNGEKKDFSGIDTIEQFIKHNKFILNTFAIALNQEFIPKEDYASTYLKNLDRIEILTAMQGG